MNAKVFAQRTKAVAAPIPKSRTRPIRVLGPAQDRQRGEIRQLLLRPVPQPKLVVSRAGDRDEQEADRVADRVLRLPEPVRETEAPEEEQEQQVQRREAQEAAIVSGSDAVSGPAAVQRNPASEANDTEPEEETEEKVQRQASETDTEKGGDESAGDPFEGSAPNELEASANEEPWPEPEAGELESATTVQTKAIGAGGGMIADPGLASRITAPSGGHPLPGVVRGFMEPRLGYEFGQVRVHDAEQDRTDAAQLKAQAFTYRNHIWLGRGQSADNRSLMAHELVHVVQQRSAVQRRVSPETDTAKSQEKPGWDIGKWGKELLEKGLETGKQVVKGAGEIAKDPQKSLLGLITGFLTKLPGFALLTVVLGRNPFTGEVVERTPISLIRGFLTLLPNGEELYANLQKSRMLERTFVWLNNELVRLNITFAVIMGLVKETFEVLAGFLLNPGAALEKLKQIFAAPLTRLLKFVAAVGKKVGEVILAGFLMLAGPLGEKVLALIGKAKNAFSLILKDPIGFVKNLMAALGQGFMQFKDRILVHLQAGLLGWLFGTLQGAGLRMPEKFDLKGLVSIVLQVLGLTYERLRAKLVKLIGEKRVQFLEKALTFVKVLVTEGLAGLWRMVVASLTNLKEMVIEGIRDWVVTQIVQSAVIKLLSMLNPAGAILQAIIAAYNVIAFFIERIEQIIDLANSIFDSLATIASGKLKAAADYVEKTMAKTLPVIISFLARLIGLGGIADKIRNIIKKIQAKIDKVLDRVIGFIKKKAKKLFGKIKTTVKGVLKKGGG